MAKDNLTKQANVNATARAIDFVSRFSDSWQALMNIIGITNMIEKVPGQTMKVIKAQVELENGSVGEGEEIPYSLASVIEEPIGEATLEKYAKAVSIEAINKYGYDVAVDKTDKAFLAKLQKVVMGRFYSFLATGALTAIDTTFQMALAMAKARVLNRFSLLGKEATDVVGFVNVLDFYKYLGGASITVQSAFGMQYVKDFMGYNTIFLCDADQVAQNKVIAIPVDNMVAYYVNPSVSDFAKAGLEFTVDGETPILGFHTNGNYTTLVSENTALMGLYLFAEYLDGICVETVEASGSLGSVTASSAAGTVATGDSVITITGAGTYYYKTGSSAASATYLDYVDSAWTPIKSGDVVNTTDTKITVIKVNGAGQIVAVSSAVTLTKKS